MAHVHVVIYGSMFQRLVHVPLTAQILATSPGYARDVVAVSPNPSRTAKPVSAGPFFPLDELQDDGNSHSAVHPSPHNQLAMDQNSILGPQVGSEATLPLNPSPPHHMPGHHRPSRVSLVYRDLFHSCQFTNAGASTVKLSSQIEHTTVATVELVSCSLIVSVLSL